MRKTYQLAPIPPFRGGGAKIPVSTSTSSCSSTLSEMTQSQSSSSLAISVDDESLVAPLLLSSTLSPRVFHADQNPSTSTSPPLTSFHVTRRRPSILSKLKAEPPPAYSLTQHGADALPPPSSLPRQPNNPDRCGANSSSSPDPPSFSKAVNSDIRASLVPLRFQTKKTFASKPSSSLSSIKGTPVDENNPDRALISSPSRSERAAQAESYFASLKSKNARNAMSALSFPSLDGNSLTPPPTPDTRLQKAGSIKSVSKLAASLNGPNLLTLRGLPPTPSTSPINKVHSPLTPLTVSAKALSLHRLNPLFDRTYLIGDELGSGGFGFVVQATRQNDGLLCAVKFIYKDKIPSHAWVKDDFWGDEDDCNGILRSKDGVKRVPLEAYVLKTIQHRGVVSYVDLFEDQSYLYLVMEHHGSPWAAPEKENKPILSSLPLHAMTSLLKITPSKKKPLQPYVNGTLLPSGPRSLSPSTFSPALSIPTQAPAMMRRSSCDLFECIEQHSRLPEHFAKYVFAQLVDVVGCLHYNGFVHRDIKDENIVIDDKYRVKLIDFGSTFLFDYRKEVPSLARFYGTMNFAAPEILKKGTYQPIAAEIWSLGILLTILVTGESFFRDTEAVKGYRASAPNSPISESCMDLIFRCLAYDPNDRWNCFRIRTHPWLADCLWPWSDVPRDASLEGNKRVRK